MIKIEEKEKCCGCYSCVNSCPVKCIALVTDQEGFEYPVVDETKCINCGLCEKNCPILQAKPGADTEPPAYAMMNKEEEVRLSSSSGGVFHAVAKEILKEDGVVFGSALVENGRTARHMWVEKEADLGLLRGSKYIQSFIGNTYTEAKEFLQAGRKVLFTGTPCQIEGLKAFLEKDYENLYCLDIICHGVPSPKVWSKYLDYREKKAKAKVKNANFRKKVYGWKGFSMYIEFENGKVYQRTFPEDIYMNVFLKDICLRPSCHKCEFKKWSESSDITIADFWGVGRVAPKMDDDKGTSLALINSPKGQELFKRMQSGLACVQVDLKESLRENPQMLTSAPYNPNREAFFEDLEKMAFDKLAKKYAKPVLDHSPKAVIVRILRRAGIYDKLRNRIKNG